MKTLAIKNFTKTVAATMSAVFAFTLVPMALGQNAVVAATAITKDQSNTSLGVSGIKDPTSGGDTTSPWTGSYVYFGNYNGPIKFRVLKVDSTAHTKSKALFLDCDSILKTMAFDDDASNVWADSEVKSWLKDDFFTSTNFTQIEMGSVLDTNTDEEPHVLTTATVSDWSVVTYGSYVPLSGEKVFLLDAEEASNSTYGYSVTDDSCASRKKTGGYGYWWLRSARSGLDDYAGVVSRDDFLSSSIVSDGRWGVAPALNISQKSIIFNTAAGNEANAYKLTILDENLIIAVPAGQNVTAAGTTITVPYAISGTNAGNATRASILITDKAWNESDANIILYNELGASTASSGTFTLPSGRDLSGWGTDYHVYILAEDINDVKETDYASEPVEIWQTYTVTYTISNGTWSDSSTADITETVVKGSSPSSIPAGMIASGGYEGGSWDTDPSTATITSDTTFTYSFSAIPNYTVTYKVVNGTWSDGSTKDITEIVAKGSTPASIPASMIASDGCEGGSWDTDPGTATISADTTFTYTFDAIPTYTVTVQNDGNGTATANVTSGSKGTEVILTATPSTGYQFKEWQVVSGGVTISDGKFTIGTEDVTVKAVFEAKPADPVEPTSVEPVNPTTVDPVIPAEPAAVEPPKSTGPFTYTVVGGGDTTWTEGDPDLVVKVTSDEDGDHSFDRYEYTAIDGTKLTDEQAPATSGSTVITIKSDLLKTLSEGKHTILVNFSDNSITTTVTIVKKAAGTSNVPSTGEVIGVSAIAGSVMILTACSMLVVMRTKKREDEQ